MMDWNQLISNKRLGQEDLHYQKKDDRTEFHRDYDRLIFSSPFRRLQNKTQVFPLPGSIFVHNRLTHSLEVASVGRSLGDDVARRLSDKHPELKDSHLSECGSIVSAACLAHDMGNPPFGHSGERAIAAYFTEGAGQKYRELVTPEQWKDLVLYEGNANAFRLLTHQFKGRRPGGFIRHDLFHSCIHREIPLSSHLCWRKAEIRLLPKRDRYLSQDSQRTGNTPNER